ncbi:unnamed protein product [Musa hybrid cultivar]
MVEPLCSPIHGRSDVSATPIIDHARFDYLEVSVFDTWPYDVSAALYKIFAADCRMLGVRAELRGS